MNKHITRNQHYVPQCLLKHFACDAKKGKKINVFDTDRYIVRYNQSIKEVFSQNYFYDKDNRTENFISQYIETPASTIIDEIINGNLDVSNEQRLTLNTFILSLFYRTPEASERASAFVNSQFESMVQQFLSLNGFDPELASAGNLIFYPDRLASMLTLEAVIDAMILKDLKYHIIKNGTKLEFYISDHPVFIYNWLYKDLEHSGVTSLAAIGLQIFIPLSPNITLALYDPKVYKYGQRSSVTNISNNSDIEILNSYQIINSNSIIGFYSRESEAYLKQLYARYKDVKLHQYESSILSTNKKNNDKIKSTHLVFTRQAKLKKIPSFITIKKKSKRYASSYQERDFNLSAKHMEFKRLMDERGQRSIIELN